jgi:hypothetical protein
MTDNRTEKKRVKRRINGDHALKIESGIPLPREGPPWGAISGALGKLKVGDSVLLPFYTRTDQLGSIRAIMQRRANMRLTTKAVDGGVRVWRIA